MKKQSITIKTTDGDNEIEAYVDGNYAINKEDDGWNITYIPLGVSLPKPNYLAIKTKKQAIELIALWREFVGEEVPYKINETNKYKPYYYLDMDKSKEKLFVERQLKVLNPKLNY